jgi:hypothetical protein
MSPIPEEKQRNHPPNMSREEARPFSFIPHIEDVFSPDVEVSRTPLGGISIQTLAGGFVGDILDGADVIVSFRSGTAFIAAGAIT